MIFTASFLLLSVFASSGGHLSVSRAMKRVGEVHDLSPRGLLAMIRRAGREGFLWAGFGCNAVSFFSLLILLTRENLSFVVPATALSSVVATLGAKFLLGEQVSAMRWAGVLLVALGVALTALG